MNKKELSSLYLRGGAAYSDDMVILLACDPKVELMDPHVDIFLMGGEVIQKTWAKFNAHVICKISKPLNGFVFLSEDGFYGVNSKELTNGNIFDSNSLESSRYGSFRGLTEIDGYAHAVGYEGMVYCLVGVSEWIQIDSGLPKEFRAQAIDGFTLDDLYVCGLFGVLWWRTGNVWQKIDLPTNTHLTSIKCCSNGFVYIGGHNGILFKGKRDSWEDISNMDMVEDIWSIEYAHGFIYISTLTGLFILKKGNLEAVKFQKPTPKTFYKLSLSENKLWSIGEKDVLNYDGINWKVII